MAQKDMFNDIGGMQSGKSRLWESSQDKWPDLFKNKLQGGTKHIEEKYSRLVNIWKDILTNWILTQTNKLYNKNIRRELGNDEHWVFDGIKEFFSTLLGLKIVLW